MNGPYMAHLSVSIQHKQKHQVATCVSPLVFEDPKSFRRCCLSRNQSSSVPLTRVSWHICTPGASFLTKNSHKIPCSELPLSSKNLQAQNE